MKLRILVILFGFLAVIGCKEPTVYTVTYDGNENTGGSPPVDENSYEANAPVKVLGNPGDLEKMYTNFSGWNTEADGSGTVYFKGNRFNIGASHPTLYAYWRYALLLRKTGQETSYGTGDDADIQAGVDWPNPRFIVDNEHGTVRDTLTGLIWQQAGDASGLLEWEEALAYCNDLTLAGCDDWRLPNRKEMLSLLNFEEAFASDWLSTSGFTGVQNDYYWTSNVDPDSPTSDAWYIDMSDTDFIDYQSQSSSGYALAVRGSATGRIHLPVTGQTTSYASGDDGDVQAGVEWPDPRFADNGDGTITDRLTGLMWQQVGDASGLLEWEEALAYCNGLTLAGYDDWRLPNVLEIESLLHYGESDIEVWLASNGFVDFSDLHYYWSSTVCAFQPGNRRWYLDLGDGLISNTTLDRSVIAVRAGD